MLRYISLISPQSERPLTVTVPHQAWESLCVISIAVFSKELFEYQVEAKWWTKTHPVVVSSLSLLPVRDTLV